MNYSQIIVIIPSIIALAVIGYWISTAIKRRISNKGAGHAHGSGNQVNCNFVLPRLPPKDSTIDDQLDWINQCELTLGTSLGTQNVFIALSKEMIGPNYDIIKSMAAACEKITDCNGKYSCDSVSKIILKGIPDKVHRKTIGYLWEFYLESKKLTLNNKRLQDCVYGRRVGNNAPQAQLMLVLHFSINEYLDLHS